MKKIILFIMLFLALLFLPSIKANADIGPKSTVTIQILGVDKEFFADLLFEYSLPDENTRNERYEQSQNYFNQAEEVPLLLKDYSEDGFVSALLYRARPTVPSSKSLNYLKYTYVPPKTFKIILIFKDNTYITSNTITTKLFNSNVTWDLKDEDLSISKQGAGTLNESIPYKEMTLDLLVRIVLTVLIEIVILFLFGYRLKKSFIIVLIVNIITQTILTIFMFQMRYFTMPLFGEVFALVAGEILILIIESITFRKLLKEHSKRRAQIYTFVANFGSIAIGFILMFVNFMNSIK